MKQQTSSSNRVEGHYWLKAAFVMSTGTFVVGAFLIARLLDTTDSNIVILTQWGAITVGAILLAGGTLCAVRVGRVPPSALRLSTNISISVASILIPISVLEYQLSTKRPSDYLLPPNTIVEVKTHEFTYKASVNALGIRGDAVALKADEDTCRIAVIGDSFVYGWGVEDDETMPYVLTEILGTRTPVEFLNFGHPGWGPPDYVKATEIAVQFNPNLIIIALLQYDDLHQASGDVKRLDDQPYLFLFNQIRHLIIREITTRDHIEAETIREEWEAAARKVYEGNRDYLDGLDDEVLDAYLAGQINPAILGLSVTDPDYYTTLLDYETTQQEISILADRLSIIQATAGTVPVIILSIPDRPFTEVQLGDLKRLGFNTSTELLTFDADEPFEQAASLNEIPFISVSDQFRRSPDPDLLYYRFDGHFTRAGQQQFAALAAEALWPRVSEACGH